MLVCSFWKTADHACWQCKTLDGIEADGNIRHLTGDATLEMSPCHPSRMCHGADVPDN